MYSCQLFLISSSVRSLPFFVLYCDHPCMKCSLDISSFLEEISNLRYPIVSSTFHFSSKKPFFSPFYFLELCIQLGCLSLHPFLFASFLSSVMCKTSSDNHFAFLCFFFFGIILVIAPYAVLQTSVHSFSGTLTTRSNSLNLFVPLM